MPRLRGMGSVYKQPNSRFWWIKYHRNGNPFRESAHSEDRQAAVQLLKKRLAEIATGEFCGPKSERTTMEELAADFLREYRVTGRKSLGHAEHRWRIHLKPFFGDLRAVQLTSDLISRYVDERQQKGAENATINRELAALRRMLRLGMRSTPPKVLRVPAFPRLREDNVRQGFLEQEQFEKLLAQCTDVWFRTLLTVARTYGWRKGELLNMRISQVDLLGGTIRLHPGTTKNREGREVTLTPELRQLLTLCIHGKRPEDFLFTREDGERVKDFRKLWWNVCTAAGLGHMECCKCGEVVTGDKCEKCDLRSLRYVGLIFHDLRRTAARNLRRAGVAEGVIMKIGGWRTRSVFERYAIVSQSDISDAMDKLRQFEFGHRVGHSEPETPQQNATDRAQ